MPTTPLQKALFSVVATLMLSLPLLAPTAADAAADTEVVFSAVETDPVHHPGDAADDIAIWVHPTTPARSLIIGTDKRGGIAVYDLNGGERQYLAGYEANNVDLRAGFNAGGQNVTLVAISEVATDTVEFFKVDPGSRLIEPLPGVIDPRMGTSGLCMHRSLEGDIDVFVGDSSGNVEQWRLDWSDGRVTGTEVRRLEFGSTTEGCVADDALGWVYFAEEGNAIWRFGADPSDGTNGTRIARVKSNGGDVLEEDIEGLALYRSDSSRGYLVASSQGADEFVVMDRQPPHAPRGVFRVNADAIDGVSHTDGIEVTSAFLGDGYAGGLFVVQDDTNDDGNRNFKLVPWDRIADALELESGPQHAPTPSSPQPSGIHYYIDSEAGDDSRTGRSPGQAWESLDRLSSVNLDPGNRVLLKRGSVFDEPLEIDASGTPSERIVIRSYGEGQKPRITSSSTCVSITGDYVYVSQLEVTRCEWAGVSIEGHHNIVRGNRIAHNATGIYLKEDAHHNIIRNNIVVDNNVMSVLTEHQDDDDSGAFGILIHGDRNRVFRNTISGSAAFSYDYGVDGAAIEIYGGSNNRIHHNVTHDNDAFAELGEPDTSGNIFAYNEVTSSLDTSVFIVQPGAESSRGPVIGTVVHHNAVYLSGESSQGFVCYSGCDENSMRVTNNFIWAGWKVGYADGPIVADHNTYRGGIAQFELGDHSAYAIRPLVDPTDGDLRPSHTSLAADTRMWLDHARDLAGTTPLVGGDSRGRPRIDRGTYGYVP